METNHNLQQSSGRWPQSAKRNRYAVGNSIAVLFCPAANGKTFAVTIDKEDLPRVVARGFWRVRNVSGNKAFSLYCTCSARRRRDPGPQMIYLHRFVVGAEPHDLVDHIHHRTLDNRKSEIRKTDRSTNGMNLVRGMRPRGSRPYRGVWLLPYGRWRAMAGKVHLGCFDTPEQARDAVISALRANGVEV